MRIQYLNGGLANQAFQYIFARYAELAYPEGGKVWLDDSFFFFNDVHNGYELDKVFGIKANLLSEYFTPDVWTAILEERKKGHDLGVILKNMDMGFHEVRETSWIEEHLPDSGITRYEVGNISYVKMGGFFPDVVCTSADTYFHGYWINKGYFEKYADIFSKEFSFPNIVESYNKSYAEEIKNTISVAFHVRRGDYVKLNYNLPTEFYAQQVERILSVYPQAVFFVFSDEPDYCREYAHELGFDRAVKTVYVEGNDNGLNYRDLQLMSMCKGIVLSNSAFCFLAGVLNRKKKFWTDYINREL